MRPRRKRCVLIPAARILSGMGLLYFLADSFVNTFGITQPTEKARKQAAFFILGLLVLLVCGVAAVGYVLLLATR